MFPDFTIIQRFFFSCLHSIIVTSKFWQPSYIFTDKEHRGPFEFSDELGSTSITPEVSSDIVPAQQFEANDKDLLLSTDEKDDNKGLSSNNGSAYTAPYESSNISSQMQELAISGPAASATTTQSSFDFDDLLGLGLSTAPAPTPSPPLLKLNARAALDPRAFQQKWRQLPISLSQVFLFPHSVHLVMLFMKPLSTFLTRLDAFGAISIVTYLTSFAGVFCEPPRNRGLDSSTITYQTHAESFHSLHRIGRSISKLQVLLLCSKGSRTLGLSH